MTVRRMAVVRAPSTNGKPMIRIVNNLLTKAGFEIGTPFEVTYEQNIITLKIIDHATYKLQKPSSPVAIPAASVTSGEAGAGKVAEYARRAEPCEIAPGPTVSGTIQPMCYVLTGSWHYGHPKNARVSRRAM